MLRNLDADAANPEAAGPGHWNDPDYLGPDQGMSAAQFRTQFSMWAMLAAPLMISGDLVSLSSASQTTVTSSEAIAIDQDPAGQQARLLSANGSGQVWVKPLSDGARAVALLNRSSRSIEIATSAAAVGMPAAGGVSAAQRVDGGGHEHDGRDRSERTAANRPCCCWWQPHGRAIDAIPWDRVGG